MTTVLVFAGILASFGAAAQSSLTPAPQATPTAAVPPVADAKPADPDSAIICRYEMESGTRFMSRICHTRRQWKQKERDAYDLLDRLDSGKDQTIFQ